MKLTSNKITANFFWHGSELSIYEKVCLRSFLKSGFKVVVYSFKKITLPKNIIFRDANTILKKSEIKKFIHGGKKGCLAAYSDKFRILLQKKKLGWWFDLDIICLKNFKYFNKLEKNKKIIIGYETKYKVNNAVLKVNNPIFINEILEEINKIGYKFRWGEIGPILFTNFLKKKNLKSEILNKKFFYPINYENIEILLDPKKIKDAIKLIKTSYTLHLYNQILNRIGLPKNILPPKNSYLYNLMIKISPEYKKLQTLPVTTFYKLLNKKNGFKENLFDLIPSFLRAIRRF
tara:strand:+ start:508 stop:1377 length:870 start_codon:yes stop_codon:yes gene_type:complete